MHSECACSHFSKSNDCPSCGKKLGADDCVEVNVSGPTQASTETLKTCLQTAVATRNATDQTLSMSDMCSKYLRYMDDGRRFGRLLLKQLHSQASTDDTSSALAEAHEEIARLKQALSSTKLQAKETQEALGNQLNGKYKGHWETRSGMKLTGYLLLQLLN